jgi:hypothetical protein
MLIAARHHQHLIALETMIAGKDIAWQDGADDLADMGGTLGIGPGNADKDALRHKNFPSLADPFEVPVGYETGSSTKMAAGNRAILDYRPICQALSNARPEAANQ